MPSFIFDSIFLSGFMILPMTLTGEYGFISPFLPIGVGPKNRHIALPLGQYATSFTIFVVILHIFNIFQYIILPEDFSGEVI